MNASSRPASPAAAGRSPELQHLRAFEAIYRLGSLTEAARELSQTQPALSKALAALRRFYDDELFSRSKQGMRPTPRARELQQGVQQLLHLLDHELAAREHFDAGRSQRVFRIACTEVGTVHFMPRLLGAARSMAPAVRWEILPLQAGLSEAQLANGEVDLVLAAFTDLGPQVCSEPLYEADFACLVRDDHPRLRTPRLSLAEFAAERHLLATVDHPGHAYGRVEQLLLQTAGAQAIGLRVPSLLAAPYILSQTDLIFTATRALAVQMLQRHPGLRLLDCPLPIAPISIHQYWHSRFADSAALQWLRGLVRQHFARAR